MFTVSSEKQITNYKRYMHHQQIPTQVVLTAFTRLIAAGMNDLLNLLVLHCGRLYLHPDGSSMESLVIFSLIPNTPQDN